VQLITKLISEELGLAPTIVSCRRIGKLPTVNQPKPQLLLVVFSSSVDVQLVVSQAHRLWRAEDNYVRTHVYINAHLTRAESEAAYIARCQRRQRLRQGVASGAASGRMNVDVPEFMTASTANATPLTMQVSQSQSSAADLSVPESSSTCSCAS